MTVVAGGWKDYLELSTVTMYRNGRTEALPDLPHPVSAASLTVYKDKLRMCGGYINASHIASKECFQLSIFNTLSKWEKGADLPVKMRNHNSVQVLDDMWVFYENKIYVMPQTGNVTVIPWRHGTFPELSCALTNGVCTVVIPDKSRDVFINSDSTSPGSWVKLAMLPTGLERRSCLMMGSFIYVTGGHTPANATEIASNETYVIDIEGRGSVTRVGDQLTARWAHAMGVIDGAPAVFGGWDGVKYLDDTEVFDTKTKMWRASDIKMAVPSASIGSISFVVN